MTSSELIQSVWNRRKPNSWSAGMTIKQVGFFLGLLDRERKLPPTRQTSYHVYGLELPLEVVVYPNGAGFVRVEQWAMTPDETMPSKWRLKTKKELELSRI